MTAPKAKAIGKKPLKTRATKSCAQVLAYAAPRIEVNPRRVVNKYMGRRPYLLASGIHSQGATPLMAMHIVLFKKKLLKVELVLNVKVYVW